jgi:uncharacterized membrane protein (DUF4010 family)
VLIVGLGLAGFVAQKLFGERSGLLAAGLLGGLVSSTATTVSYSRAAKARSGGWSSAALVIMLASTVVYPRLLVAASIAAPKFSDLRWPFAILGAASLMICGVLFVIGRREAHEPHAAENPTEFRTALLFAGLYALISLATAAARHWFGDAGLFGVAAVSGLTDLDAITLSTCRLVASGKLHEVDGWRMIVIAVVANLSFKSVLVLVLGSRHLFLRAGLAMLATAVLGVVIVIVG